MELRIEKNALKELPALAGMVGLQVLEASGNALRRLPVDLPRRLHTLRLNDNQLTVGVIFQLIDLPPWCRASAGVAGRGGRAAVVAHVGAGGQHPRRCTARLALYRCRQSCLVAELPNLSALSNLTVLNINNNQLRLLPSLVCACSCMLSIVVRSSAKAMNECTAGTSACSVSKNVNQDRVRASLLDCMRCSA